MATFQAGVEWARHNANSLPSDIQSKLLRLYRTAKEGDRKAQDEYLAVLSSAAPGWSGSRDTLAPPTATAVRKGHEFNAGNLARYLEGKIPDFVPPFETVLQFQGGQSNPTFYLRDSRQHEYVLRKRPPGELLPSAHAVEREYRVMKALYSVFPVPKMLVLCEDPSVIGQTFYVMEFIRGRIFRDVSLPNVHPDQRSAIYDAMNETLALLHSLDYRALGLADYGKPGNYYARQVERWAQQYEASKTGTMPDMEALIAWLKANVPADDGLVTLTHGDYRLDNILFHPTEPRVLAVLDWELSTLGHPMSDLAYNCQVYHGSPVNGSVEMPSFQDSGIPSERMFRDQYARRTKRSLPDSLWTFCLAFSMFRGAAILQGVYKRSILGNASDERAKLVGSLAATCASIGLQLAQGKGSADKASRSSAPSIFEPSVRLLDYKFRVVAFMERHIYPGEAVFEHQHSQLPNRWTIPPIVEDLKAKARALGLWNLFLPDKHHGAGLSNLEYATLCEIMGRSGLAPEVFNCSAPDTGNMEILHMFGTEAQQKQWLEPLLDGKIRSCFGMTEPGVASSDATNIQCSIERKGDEYVINGRKWWITGAGDPRCKICILMGRTDPKAAAHMQQSMVLVPMNTPGVRIVRPLQVFGIDDAPFGHMELEFKDVRVSVSNILLGEGRGFEIAQARLGPGRIHHCMRLIGAAEVAIERLCSRVKTRRAFGRALKDYANIQNDIANSRIELEQARLLVLRTAHAIDTVGARNARMLIAAIKVAVPNMAANVLDRAMQAHGAAGFTPELGLARAWIGARSLRMADGPDDVHRRTVAQFELAKIARL